MIIIESPPTEAVLPVTAGQLPPLAPEVAVIYYSIAPDYPQPKPKLAAIDVSMVVDGVTPDYPQPKPK